MKHKRQSDREDKYPAARETLRRYLRVKRKLPWDWWLHPSFSIDLELPFSYVWFGYWLMVWEWDDHQLPLWERKIEKFFGIRFMPD